MERLSVLVVEDTKPMLNLIETVLENIGVGHVYTAHDGQHGLEIFKKHSPDIILCDWEMPEFDGIAFTKEIRTNRTYPNRSVPIIMVTGYGMKGRVALARDAGITEFIVKPFTANVLVSRLAQVINSPRDFIECDTYVGPDRRRKKDPKYKGPFRRADDAVDLTFKGS